MWTCQVTNLLQCMEQMPLLEPRVTDLQFLFFQVGVITKILILVWCMFDLPDLCLYWPVSILPCIPVARFLSMIPLSFFPVSQLSPSQPYHCSWRDRGKEGRIIKFTSKEIEQGELVSVNVHSWRATKGDKNMHLRGVDGIVPCVPIMLALQ